MKPRPLVYTPDDSPRFLEPGFEPRADESGLLVLIVALALVIAGAICWACSFFGLFGGSQ